MLAARVSGLELARVGACIGTLMNTRGLTELIVLNLALEKGVISRRAVRDARDHGARHDVHGRARCCKPARPAQRVRRAGRGGARARRAARAGADLARCRCPSTSILVAPADRRARCAQLLALAEPLARSEPPRELILARLVRAAARRRRARRPADRAAVQLADASQRGRRRRGSSCSQRGVRGARGRVHLDRRRAQDLVQLADGRGGRPRCSSTAAGRCSATACRAATSAPCCARRPCDVAVLVAREDARGRARGRRAGARARSAGPSTTGPRSSSAPGSRRRPARRCSCSARPADRRGQREPPARRRVAARAALRGRRRRAACWPSPARRPAWRPRPRARACS